MRHVFNCTHILQTATIHSFDIPESFRKLLTWIIQIYGVYVTTLIVQISDLHFKESDSIVFERAQKIASAFNFIGKDVSLILVAVTGDIAFSGNATQYLVAKEFFLLLKHGFEKLPHKPTVRFIAVPGNHDCELSTDDPIRNVIIEKIITTEKIEPKFIESLTAAQNTFFDFLESTKEIFDNISFSKNKLSWSNIIEHQGKSFQFLCFNTAWMSQLEEKQANLIFPIENLDLDIKPSNVNISLLHHPFNWMKSDNAKVFQREIEKKSDIILTGHEHVTHSYIKTSVETSQQVFIEGGVLNDSHNEESSTFNSILVDLNNLSLKRQHFSMQNGSYLLTSESSWEAFLRNKSLTRNQFEIDRQFEIQLKSAGASFSHPRVDTISLDHIYVFPDLQDISNEKEDSDHEVTDASMIFSQLKSEKSILIFGSEQSGKTALARKLFIEAHQDNMVPIILNGADLKKHHTDWENLEKIIKRDFEKQYENTDWNAYSQLNKVSKILILDDLDSCPLNFEGKNKILSSLQPHFSAIIAFTEEVFQIEEIAAPDSEASALNSFQRYRILEFGHSKRSELIEKWMSLGCEYTSSPVEIEKKCAKAEFVLHTALIKRLLPPYPIVILICLQQLEFDKVNEHAGSYGYLFDSLIRDSLLKATFSNFDTDAALTYLGAFADELSKVTSRDISFNDLHDFHERHRQEYGVSISIDTLLSRLIFAGVLTRDDANYRFKYKYFYFYFIARHLSRSMKEEGTVEKIQSMAREIHLEENANVLMFLSFFTPDNSIIDIIVSEAETMFSNLAPCDFSAVSKKFNGLDVSVVDHYLELPEDIRKARKDALRKKDIKMRQKKDSDAGFEQLHDINRASKTIQVLGQILRNYPGSLKRDRKRQIAAECYSLSMRSLCYVYNIIDQHQDYVLHHMVLRMDIDQKAKSRDELRKAARGIFYYVNQSIAYSFIQRVSRSVGTEKLELIFADLLRDEKSISTDLIDLSIKLEHQQAFPDREIKSLVDRYKENKFVFGIIAILVRNYMFLYPSDYSTRQKVSSIFGFKMKDLRVTDLNHGSRKLIESKDKAEN